jgi:hypothetical protein
MDTAITPHLDLTGFRSMGSAKSRLVSVQPENTQSITGNSGTQDLYFALPAGSMSMINGQNSSLCFDLVASSAATLCNGSASSLIRGLELIVGNQSVELLDRYNVFAALVEDHQNKSRAQNVGSILSGHAQFAPNVPTGNQDTGATAGTALVDAKKTGKDISTKIRVSIPLYSAVIGTMCSQYCPAVDGIRLRLTLAPNDEALQYSGTPAYTMSKISLNMDYLDVNPAVYSALVQESGGVFKIHGSGVSNFNSTASAAGNHTILVPARFSSIKNYFAVFRRNDAPGANGTAKANKNTTGGRYFPNLQQYVWRIEGRQYPSVPIALSDGTTSYSGEGFQELVKAFHATHSPDFDIVYNNDDYLYGDGLTATEGVFPDDPGTGAYALALDFEETGYGQIRGLVSGMDTINSNTFLELKCDTNNISMDCDVYAVYDLILEINMMDGSVNVSK